VCHIPFCSGVKTAQVKTIERVFKKETSVFKLWLPEKESKVMESIDTDCKLWKLPKLIKGENASVEIENCRKVMLKHAHMMKGLFS
jgi:hypothetical protein